MAEKTIHPPKGEQQERGRSVISFPYFHLEKCIELAAAVMAIGGDSCELSQLAAHLGQSESGGGFRVKIIATRVFGLISYQRKTVELTPIGQRILDPEMQKAARVEAFLTVPLFNRMYEKLNGQMLPPDTAIEKQMQGLGVAPKQASRARQVFLRSAREAGFFDINPSRLTKPPIGTSQVESSQKVETHAKGPSLQRPGGPTTPKLSEHHPLIEALLAEMPPPGTEWELAHCAMWFESLRSCIGIIYSNYSELKGLEISVGRQN